MSKLKIRRPGRRQIGGLCTMRNFNTSPPPRGGGNLTPVPSICRKAVRYDTESGDTGRWGRESVQNHEHYADWISNECNSWLLCIRLRRPRTNNRHPWRYLRPRIPSAVPYGLLSYPIRRICQEATGHLFVRYACIGRHCRVIFRKAVAV